MARSIETDTGVIEVQDAVLANLAGIATTECYGVAGMAARNIQDGIAGVLRHDSLTRGVTVASSHDGESLVVTVNIVIGYGVNIGEVARNIRERVRYTLIHCSGFPVEKVNVNVRGVKVTALND